MEIKIIAVGNSAGVLLPKELLARLRVGKGDTLYVAETPDGIKLMPHDPHLAAQMDVAERSEEHTSELQSLMRISYAGFCLKRQKLAPQHSYTKTLPASV